MWCFIWLEYWHLDLQGISGGDFYEAVCLVKVLFCAIRSVLMLYQEERVMLMQLFMEMLRYYSKESAK